jgi:hypothetical protein
MGFNSAFKELICMVRGETDLIKELWKFASVNLRKQRQTSFSRVFF